MREEKLYFNSKHRPVQMQRWNKAELSVVYAKPLPIFLVNQVNTFFFLLICNPCVWREKPIPS